MEVCFPVENTSPENRELARVVRELGELLPSGLEVDWQEFRGRCGEVLSGIIRDSIESRRLIDLLAGEQYFVGGDEHHVIRVPTDPERIYKLTHGDNFGCRSYFSPVDPELIGHFHGETNADPFFYLNRWGLLNSIGEYQTRFEGFVPAERSNWLPRICISQPALPLENPTPKQIREGLANYGFQEISPPAFFHAGTHILLTDAAPRNVRVVEGNPIPFDAIAKVASGRILTWALERIAAL
jgi:hypothetical protein